jgi:peptidoglycan/LPS O-acetylase OafA/YrhL
LKARPGEGVRAEVGFIAPVEGLRGVAVLLVMLFHYAVVLDARFADPWLARIDAWLPAKVVVRNGMIGVDLFFLITGFLLVLPWLRNADQGTPPPSAREFYRRRARRILPAYYVQLLVLFFVLVPLLRGLEFWRYNPTYMFQNLSAHVFLVHYFTPVTSASLSVNGALWSLALEAQFYLLLPLLAPVFARSPWRTAALLLACAFAWRWLALNRLDALVGWMRAIDPSWNLSEATVRHLLYTQLPGYLGHFAAGMLAGRAWLGWRGRAPSARASAAWLALAALAGALLWTLHAPGGWFLGDATWALALAALATVFVALVARGVPAAGPLLANRPLAFVGRVSYSAYLYHLPVLLLWNAYAPAVTGWWLALPLYLAAVLSIACLSYRYVEIKEIIGVRLQLGLIGHFRVAKIARLT